ncbi:hypothetical protein SAMN05216368_102415, partial [Cryobacterium flavum]
MSRDYTPINRARATTDIGVRAETDLGNGSLAYRNGCR